MRAACVLAVTLYSSSQVLQAYSSDFRGHQPFRWSSARVFQLRDRGILVVRFGPTTHQSCAEYVIHRVRFVSSLSAPPMSANSELNYQQRRDEAEHRSQTAEHKSFVFVMSRSPHQMQDTPLVPRKHDATARQHCLACSLVMEAWFGYVEC